MSSRSISGWCGEALQHLREKGQHEILGGAEAQPAAGAGTGEELLRAPGGLEDQAGRSDQRLAVRRQGYGMRVAHEELTAEVLLEPADMVAHGGTGAWPACGSFRRSCCLPPMTRKVLRRTGSSMDAGFGGHRKFRWPIILFRVYQAPAPGSTLRCRPQSRAGQAGGRGKRTIMDNSSRRAFLGNAALGAGGLVALAGSAHADPGPGSLGDKGQAGAGRHGIGLRAMPPERRWPITIPPMSEQCPISATPWTRPHRRSRRAAGPRRPLSTISRSARVGGGPHVSRCGSVARTALARHRRGMGLRPPTARPDRGADAGGHQRDQQLQAGRPVVLPKVTATRSKRSATSPATSCCRSTMAPFRARHVLDHRLDQRDSEGDAGTRLRIPKDAFDAFPKGETYIQAGPIVPVSEALDAPWPKESTHKFRLAQRSASGPGLRWR